RRGIGRCGLTEGEAGELDEEIFNRDVATARRGEQSAVERGAAEEGRCGAAGVARTEILELEVTLAERANHAVFGRGTGIDRQCQARTGEEVVAIAVLLAEIAVPGRCAMGAAVERDVRTQITTDLDAGVGARDVEEAGA